MNLQGNTILITGGGSGIGLALAEEFKRMGNEVIVAGRSLAKLDAARSKGLSAYEVDMTSEGSIGSLISQLLSRYPSLNAVIHNAGIMANEKLVSRDNSQVAHETIASNLLGPILLTNGLLPHFLGRKSAMIMTVTSGLAFVPLAMAPTYSATKAAIHSYTQSLRYQLKGTSVEVKELVPPYVRTGLMGERQSSDPNAIPIDEFIAEAMAILRDQPEAEEILVQRAQPQRSAGFDRTAYEAFFQKQNAAVMSARKKEWDAL